MTRYALLAVVVALGFVVLTAEPQGFGPRDGKGKGHPAAAPRPITRPAAPHFTRPQVPQRPAVRPSAPTRGFVPSRNTPRMTQRVVPTARPRAAIPTAPSSRPGGIVTQAPTTRPSRPATAVRPGAVDRTPARINPPRTVYRPEFNRTTINRQNLNRANVNVRNRVGNRAGSVNRWGGSGRQIGAPRTWYSRAGNWNRTWWGGRPAWYWGRPWYWQHAGWHHGYWNYWATPPALWFGAGLLGGWLLGPGDSYAYYNPYWVAPVVVPTYLDYSVPLPVVPVEEEAVALPPDPDEATDTTTVPAAPEEGSVTEANRLLDSAREAFRAGEYTKAQVQVETAIRLVPSDPAFHEFRALTLFAQGKYQEAAGTLYAVLTAGPGWDWPTMRSMYADPEVYTAQLRALEQSVTQFPDMAYGHFLLAYHYLVGGYRDAAVRELREAVRLQPDDKLAQALLASLTSPDAGGGRSAPPSPGR